MLLLDCVSQILFLIAVLIFPAIFHQRCLKVPSQSLFRVSFPDRIFWALVRDCAEHEIVLRSSREGSGGVDGDRATWGSDWRRGCIDLGSWICPETRGRVTKHHQKWKWTVSQKLEISSTPIVPTVPTIVSGSRLPCLSRETRGSCPWDSSRRTTFRATWRKIWGRKWRDLRGRRH